MKRIIACFCLLILLCGCNSKAEQAQITATTLPVYEFASLLCDGTGIRVAQLITEDVSCLHNYTLQVKQMQAMEASNMTIISGAGLEDFLDDALRGSNKIIDASTDITFMHTDHAGHNDHEHTHHEYDDPHYWLSPTNAKIMAKNICDALIEAYPMHTHSFEANYAKIEEQLDALNLYGIEQLKGLSCRELVTFHDGFAYFAEAFDLTILKAIEEESGAEASAAELIELIGIVNENKLPAIFIEKNGSNSAANVVANETEANIFELDMCISGNSYFDAMYHNINTIKEALE